MCWVNVVVECNDLMLAFLRYSIIECFSKEEKNRVQKSTLESIQKHSSFLFYLKFCIRHFQYGILWMWGKRIKIVIFAFGFTKLHEKLFSRVQVVSFRFGIFYLFQVYKKEPKKLREMGFHCSDSTFFPYSELLLFIQIIRLSDSNGCGGKTMDLFFSLR